MYKKVLVDLDHGLDLPKFKVGDRVRIIEDVASSLNIGDEYILTEHESGAVLLNDFFNANHDIISSGLLLIERSVKDTKVESIGCLCDSRQLLNFGHDKGCNKL